MLEAMEDDAMSSDYDSDTADAGLLVFGGGGGGGGGCSRAIATAAATTAGGLVAAGGGGGGYGGGLWRPSSQPADPCYRCGKRVYPVERVDVGVLFHRRCFRCRVCGLQLTLRTFHWDQGSQGQDQGQGQSHGHGHGQGHCAPSGSFGSPPSAHGFPGQGGSGGGGGGSAGVKDGQGGDQGQSCSRTKKADVYCNVHVPRSVGHIDSESVGIKQALSAPRRGPNSCDQVSVCMYVCLSVGLSVCMHACVCVCVCVLSLIHI